MVAAAGGVDHAQLTELAAKAFGKLPSDGPSTAALVAAIAAAPPPPVVEVDVARVMCRVGNRTHVVWRAEG